MHSRKIISSEVVGFLDSWLPREITDEILAWLLQHTRDVAAAYKSVIKEVKWGTIKSLGLRDYDCEEDEDDEMKERKMLITLTIYQCGAQREVSHCPKCQKVWNSVFDSTIEDDSFPLLRSHYLGCYNINCQAGKNKLEGSWLRKLRIYPNKIMHWTRDKSRMEWNFDSYCPK